MFNLQNIVSKTGIFSKQIYNIIHRPLSTSNVALRSIRDLTNASSDEKNRSSTIEGTVGSEKWRTIDTSNFDDRLPGPELLTTSFDGILYKDLPIVYIKATKNNTLITVTDSDVRFYYLFFFIK